MQGRRRAPINRILAEANRQQSEVPLNRTPSVMAVGSFPRACMGEVSLAASEGVAPQPLFSLEPDIAAHVQRHILRGQTQAPVVAEGTLARGSGAMLRQPQIEPVAQTLAEACGGETRQIGRRTGPVDDLIGAHGILLC